MKHSAQTDAAFSALREVLQDTSPRAKTVPPPPGPMLASDLLAQAERYERDASRWLARAADLRLVAKKLTGDAD